MQKSKVRKNVAKKATRRASTVKGDIIELILEDHKPLKKLIKVMKDTDKSLSERRKAFLEFGPLLVRHAKPEESVLYARMKEEDDLREHAFEGDVEHGLADQMLEETKRTEEDDLWSARVKVLAELVEHHIEEEEGDLLPDFKKASEKEERVKLGTAFLAAKESTVLIGNEREPRESQRSSQSVQTM